MHLKDGERKKANIKKVVAANKASPGSPAKKVKRMGKAAYDVPEDEEVLNAKLKQASSAFRKEHPDKKAKHPAARKKITGVTAAQRAVNMNLAQSGNDLSVASIQHLAGREPAVKQLGPDEVEISLH